MHSFPGLPGEIVNLYLIYSIRCKTGKMPLEHYVTLVTAAAITCTSHSGLQYCICPTVEWERSSVFKEVGIISSRHPVNWNRGISTLQRRRCFGLCSSVDPSFNRVVQKSVTAEPAAA